MSFDSRIALVCASLGLAVTSGIAYLGMHKNPSSADKIKTNSCTPTNQNKHQTSKMDPDGISVNDILDLDEDDIERWSDFSIEEELPLVMNGENSPSENSLKENSPNEDSLDEHSLHEEFINNENEIKNYENSSLKSDNTSVNENSPNHHSETKSGEVPYEVCLKDETSSNEESKVEISKSDTSIPFCKDTHSDLLLDNKVINF